MTNPLIGITSNYSTMPLSLLTSSTLQRSYITAVIKAGGIPLIIPSDIDEIGWKELTTRLDGILFSGGGDIATDYFNGEDHPAISGIEPARDALELGMVREVVAAGKPFLGICRGLQSVNVALGGTLYTHIPDQVPNSLVHEQERGEDASSRTELGHAVSIQPGTYLARVTGQTRLNVNSFHHHGIKDLAPGLLFSAQSPDGVIEAVELPNHPFGLAVQWHPEWLVDIESELAIFKAFVDAAAGRLNFKNGIISGRFAQQID